MNGSTRLFGAILLASMEPIAARADVVVSTGPTQNVDCTGNVCVPTADSAVLNVTDLENLLSSGNVSVATTGFAVQAGNIEIETPLTWSSGSGLTLDAYQSIRIEKSVAVSGSGDLSVLTDDGGSSGTFSFGPKGRASFAGTTNALSINGTEFTLVATLPDLAAQIATNPTGAYALAGNYDARADGTYHSSPIATAFEGTFNGMGNTISNVRIKGKTSKDNLGLFEEADSLASISSLHLANTHIKPMGGAPRGGGFLVGGLVALSYGTVFNSSTQGTITVQASKVGFVGGVVGDNLGAINCSVSNVQIEMQSTKLNTFVLGGIAGGNSGLVDESFATGSVTLAAPPSESMVGSLVGGNAGTVVNSYATGASSDGGAGNVGGLIGVNYQAVQYSYSTGVAAAGPNGSVGGLIGYDASSQGNLQDTYWDTTTSGIGKTQGAGNIASDPGITGKTMKQFRANLPKGFDPTVWAQSKKVNGGLPYLINNPPG